MNLAVLYGCDENYVPFTGVSMTTLFENNQNIKDICVYLAGMNLSQESIESFLKTAENYGRKLVILDTKDAIKRIIEWNCGAWNGSVAAWLRFFVLDQIPEEVKRLVWIDSDTIVNAGIINILDCELNDKPIAAVCDCLSYWQRAQIGFCKDDPYYNSGVIVFNMEYWREHDLIARSLERIKQNTDRYKAPDQDFMNDMFRGKICKLPPQYNVQCFLLAYELKDYYSVYPWHPEAYYSEQELQEAIRCPVIVHFFRFLGDYPWTEGHNYHPAKGLYEEWKGKSLWKDHKGVKKKTELLFALEKSIYKLLPRRLFLRVFSSFTNRKVSKLK